MQLSQLLFLLEKINVIDFKCQQRKKSHDFNIFSILRGERGEVGLHSRFIYSLLSPFETHNQGSVFLNHFLNAVGIDGFHLKGAWVERERDSIDILIRNSTQAIIIENGEGFLAFLRNAKNKIGKIT